MGERLHSQKSDRVPDSYIVEVDGHRYCCYKRDLTLHKLWEADDSDSHCDTHDEAIATGVMPTLRLRPQLKFPHIQVQATEQKDLKI